MNEGLVRKSVEESTTKTGAPFINAGRDTLADKEKNSRLKECSALNCWKTRKGKEGENGRGFPLQRDGESLKGGRNLFATRSNDRSACWNSEYLCRLFFFFLFFFFLSWYSREFVWIYLSRCEELPCDY